MTLPMQATSPSAQPDSAQPDSTQRDSTQRKRHLRLALVAHVGFVVLVGAGAYLGALPFRVQSIHRMADKAMHFLLVGGVAFWLVGLWDDARLSVGPLRLPWAVLAPALIAGLEEGMQYFSSRRSADLLDFAADAAGLLVFWWLGRLAVVGPRPTSARMRRGETLRSR